MIHEHYIKEAIALEETLLHDGSFADFFEKAVTAVKDSFLGDHKILIAGNGGSAADAQHFAAEFIGRYKKERKAYPAIALTTDTSVLTALSNDYSFDTLFAREIEALGRPRDVFIGLSTSGNSANIIKGVKKAKEMGLTTICLLGKGGGTLKGAAHLSYIIPSDNTSRIQEMHMMILHMMCEEVEKHLA